MTTKTFWDRMRTFSFAIWILFGALAAIAAVAGIFFLILGEIGLGIVLLILAAVLWAMSLSIGKGLRDTAQ